MIAFIIITVLIILNGFFVTAEFALIGSPKTLLEKEAKDGSLLAGRVLTILNDPKKQDLFIATAQLGITLASLGLGMYGEHIIADWLIEYLGSWLAAHSLAGILSVSILTYFHIVFGEMIPKSLALQKPHQIVQWIVPLMSIFQLIVYPLVIGLNKIGNLLLRLFGVRREESPEHYKTSEELSYIVDESETEGKLPESSANLLRELLEFGELTASEVMVPRTQIIGIPSDATGDDIKVILRKKPHTRYLVYEGDLDKVLGFVHVKDLLRYVETPAGLPTEVIRALPFVPESSHLETVLKSMRKARSQMIVVMDEHGGTSGLITIEDLFEEVVGDISENSAEKAEIYRDSKGQIHALGTVRLFDLGEELELQLEHEDVDTVSGLVLASLERPAQMGDRVIFEGLEFEVTGVKSRGVKECIVRILEPKEDESD